MVGMEREFTVQIPPAPLFFFLHTFRSLVPSSKVLRELADEWIIQSKYDLSANFFFVVLSLITICRLVILVIDFFDNFCQFLKLLFIIKLILSPRFYAQ